MYADKYSEPLEIMKLMLQIRHICPTSPDTLRAYSFTETDPFLIGEAPHVFFAGNQPTAGSSWIYANDNKS